MAQEAQRQLLELSEALGLEYEQQDWGIVNADAHRLVEFIAYYEENAELSATQRFELGELILASANEHLASGSAPMPSVVRPFLMRHRNEFEVHVEYWLSLRDAAEFPVANWLRLQLPDKQLE